MNIEYKFVKRSMNNGYDKDTAGVYQKSNSSTWPTTGYRFNEDLSGCENGGTLSWDYNTNKVILTGNS